MDPFLKKFFPEVYVKENNMLVLKWLKSQEGGRGRKSQLL